MAKPIMCSETLLAKDLKGQRIVITGANSGIGLVTAQQLARQGATVVFGCRRVEEANKAIEALRAETPEVQTEVYRLDLGDLSSVRAFAESLLAAGDTVHTLINNAGVMNTPEGTTKDGFETQLGVNHIGHFLLTELLIDALARGASERGEARIVNVSSCYHDKAVREEGEIDLEDPFFRSRKYNGWKAYAQSKLANLLHAKELAKRLEDKKIRAVSVHPGWVRTNLAKHTMPLFVQNYVVRPIFSLIGMIEPWEGAQTTLHAVLAETIENGAFYSQRGLYRDRKLNVGGWPMQSPNPHAHDDALAAALYDKSQEWVAGAS